jgi:hypothetical protein
MDEVNLFSSFLAIHIYFPPCCETQEIKISKESTHLSYVPERRKRPL